MAEKKEVYLIEQATHWGQIESLAQHAVVQVCAQIGAFNWLQPYKVGKQYEGRGSGFLIDQEGFLVTNVHVVDGAKSVWVYLPLFGREPLYASVVSICPDQDIALLRLREDSLQLVRGRLNGVPHLILGDSDALQRTQGVLALGYPLGQYRLKSTTGVVSGRELVEGHSLIETTAAINPGSSGGPLINAYGQVIGIAVAAVPTANSVGYAIPINELTILLDDLRSQRLVHKPMLGAQFIYSCDEKAHYFDNPTPPGLYVSHVFKGSLFDKAGVRVGDMLYEFNGLSLDAYGDAQGIWPDENMSLHDLLTHVKIGDTISLVLYRKGTRIAVSFPFVYRQLFAIRPVYPDYEEVDFETMAGMVIMQLTSNHVDLLIENVPELFTYDLSENRLEPRLIITHIVPGSYAHQMNMLREGDIITHVNHKKVRKLQDFRRLVNEGVASGYVVLTTEVGVLIVFSLKKILDDEMRLAHDFLYPVSKTVQKLYRVMQKGGK